MLNHNPRLTALLAAAVLASLPAARALAGAADYRFELVGAHSARAGATDVTVRLVHLPESAPVPGAVIFQPRAVMAGMENMPATAAAEPGQAPGIYTLHVAVGMPGAWTLQLAAKVPGEAQTVRAAIPFEAAE
jgi:hypothetical protein